MHIILLGAAMVLGLDIPFSIIRCLSVLSFACLFVLAFFMVGNITGLWGVFSSPKHCGLKALLTYGKTLAMTELPWNCHSLMAPVYKRRCLMFVPALPDPLPLYFNLFCFTKG